MSQTIFLTTVRSIKGKACARILIDSLRAFGGALCDAPVWVFEANAQNAPCADLAGNGVRVIPLNVPEGVRDYIFGDKVYACAQAEAIAPPDTQSLVWIDPICVVVSPPVLFDLGAAFDAAVRPVHVRNVGLRTTDPLDEFWKTIYATIGVNDIASTVESFVDEQRLRAYFNSHAFAINPKRNLMRRWFMLFEQLVGNQKFQTRACADERHQVFLFQAIWSALIATSLDPERIHILPPTYNYPYNLHARVPAERRAHALNDLICFTYEERSIHPNEMTDIEIREPLKAWLAAHQEAK
ncbi:MAG: hypothetical protein FJ009_01190 [Chloroflexi bacterium]|nr:hypothetical protein [Chloroflexota bacterium]